MQRKFSVSNTLRLVNFVAGLVGTILSLFALNLKIVLARLAQELFFASKKFLRKIEMCGHIRNILGLK